MMASQIVDRAAELALHEAVAGTLESFRAAGARLRTLDRRDEIKPEQYLVMDVIANARAGNLPEARDAFARLGGVQSPKSLELKRLLLNVQESSIGSYRTFVEQLIPTPTESSNHHEPRKRRMSASAVMAGLAVIVLGAAVLFYFIQRPEHPAIEAPRSPKVVIPFSDASLVATSKPAERKPSTPYGRMQALVGMVIVRLHLMTDDGKVVKVPKAHGTGFVIAKDGLILTNRHVVEFGPEALEEGKPVSGCAVVGWDVVVAFFGEGTPHIIPGRVGHQSVYVDLATVRVDHDFGSALSFASTPIPGDRVMAYGFPGVAEVLTELLNERDAKERDAALKKKIGDGKDPDLLEWYGEKNLQLSVTAGIIGALKQTEKGMFVQTDTLINKGNSGGPLVNDQGQVVAMVTLGIDGTFLCLSGRTIFEELARETGIEWPKTW